MKCTDWNCTAPATTGVGLCDRHYNLINEARPRELEPLPTPPPPWMVTDNKELSPHRWVQMQRTLGPLVLTVWGWKSWGWCVQQRPRERAPRPSLGF